MTSLEQPSYSMVRKKWSTAMLAIKEWRSGECLQLAPIRAKVEHPFRVIKQQFGFQKTRLRGMAKNHCKVNVMAARTNLYLARTYLLATG